MKINKEIIEEFRKRLLSDEAVYAADSANWARDNYEHTLQESLDAMREALEAAILTITPDD